MKILKRNYLYRNVREISEICETLWKFSGLIRSFPWALSSPRLPDIIRLPNFSERRIYIKRYPCSTVSLFTWVPSQRVMLAGGHLGAQITRAKRTGNEDLSPSRPLSCIAYSFSFDFEFWIAIKPVSGLDFALGFRFRTTHRRSWIAKSILFLQR